MEKKYNIIYADPPWRFQNRTGKVAPENKKLNRYETMSLADIMALPVEQVAAAKSHLYLWVPNALLPDGLAVMKAWGFEYKGNIIWEKVRKDGGPDGRGVGFYFRNVTEILLFGVRGDNFRTLAPARSQVNLIRTQKREHSRKPDEIIPIIESCSPGPFLELFARGDREGWDMWGNQALTKTTPRNRCTQKKIKKEELDELCESSAFSFFNFQAKDCNDFRAANEARAKQIRAKRCCTFSLHMVYYMWKLGGDYMTMLEGFKPFNFSEGVPYVSITNNGMTFNKSVVMKLDYPEQVVLLIDNETRRIAIQVCTPDTPNAASFYKEKKNNVISVRWNGRDLLNTIQAMMGWDLSKGGFRIEGTLLKADHAMLFDLNAATELN